MELKDLRLGESYSVTGVAHTFDLSNGREGEKAEMLPEGQLLVTLLVDVDDVVPRQFVVRSQEDLAREMGRFGGHAWAWDEAEMKADPAGTAIVRSNYLAWVGHLVEQGFIAEQDGKSSNYQEDNHAD